MELTLDDLPESCTAEEAADLIAALARRLVSAEEPPSLRTLRLWRGKNLLSVGGRRLTRKNLLEVLGILRLRADGLALAAAAARCIALDEKRLLLFVAAPHPPGNATTVPENGFALATLQLLAQGILVQYRLVSSGAIVGHSNHRRTDTVNTATLLRQAAARLGRLYFEEGCEDRAASVHALLAHCMAPLGEWAPASVAALPEIGNAVLIDPDYRVPSEDCAAIAQQAAGASLDDLIEHRLHRELTQTLVRLGDEAKASAAYTAIRTFVGRHPLATTRELHSLYAQPDLPTAAVEFVRHLYSPAHASFAVGGRVSRCNQCKALVGLDGRCTLSGCRDDHPKTVLAEPVPLADALVAQPAVLKYWADPAREELRLYDGLVQAGMAADLYPHQDRCDVALGEQAGVDVKDYRDPARLAATLNRGIGGLAYYPRAILAVADRRARSGDYLERLREHLLPEYRVRLEVRSVSETLRVLRREHRDLGRREGRAGA